jgi:hypothetical protein
MFCERREKWEAEDFDEILAELEKKPLNRQLLSPVVSGYLAGLLDAGGEVGYITLRNNEHVYYVPYIGFHSSREVLDFVLRQVGDGIIYGNELRHPCLYVTGLRAVILFRVIGPYLRGVKKRVSELISDFGYKLTKTTPTALFKTVGLETKRKSIFLNGQKVTKIVAVC